MPRPGPLQELPLEHFLPPNPNLPENAKPRLNKRAVSPAQPLLYSPAKRRILNEEGIFSLDKSSFSASRGRASPAKFADALRGPNSPAKKLDFGVPKNYAESSRPISSSSSTTLAPSPDSNFKSLASTSMLDHDEPHEIDDCFSSPYSLTAIPRELPPQPNPQSTHYPGFLIHHDTRIILDRARSVSVESGAAMTDPGSDADVDKDGQKENIAPRRRARRPVTPTSPSDHNPMLLKKEAERHGKARSTPATPKKNPMSLGAREGPMTPTPRRPGSGARLMLPSPGLTPVVREKERLERRRILADEADEVTGGDDEWAF